LEPGADRNRLANVKLTLRVSSKVSANRVGSDDAAGLRRFGIALARDDRFVLDDVGANRLVDKLVRQAGVATIDEPASVGRHGRIGVYARFVQLYRRHVRRLALEETDEAWSEAAAPRGGSEIAGAIRWLPLELREALLLVVLAGFSHDEAAEALDLPPARLLERLARARERLAAQMGAYADPAQDLAWRGAPHLRVIK